MKNKEPSKVKENNKTRVRIKTSEETARHSILERLQPAENSHKVGQSCSPRNQSQMTLVLLREREKGMPQARGKVNFVRLANQKIRGVSKTVPGGKFLIYASKKRSPATWTKQSVQ